MVQINNKPFLQYLIEQCKQNGIKNFLLLCGYKHEVIKNWLQHFGLIGSERDWHQVHVSGHGDGEQIKHVIDGANAKKLIPIHTQHDEYHKKWHSDVHTVSKNQVFDL